jgi:CTP-dependent riboflavin kinase
MVKLIGKVSSGLGNASKNFKINNVDIKIAKFLGVREVVPGTLNIMIQEEYRKYDNGKYGGFIEAVEYNGTEWIKLKLCKLNGFKSVIVRPLDHFDVDKFRKRVEIMSSENLRDKFGLEDGDEVALEFQGNHNWWNND